MPNTPSRDVESARAAARNRALGAALLLVGLGACAPSVPAPAAVQLTSATDTIEGFAIHYRHGGNGPPLLLLHGFGGSTAMWDRYADSLGRAFTLVIPDMPGHGHSAPFPRVWSHPQVASLMFQLLDRLGHQRVSAIGCSAGANVLLHMALQHPSRIRAMVLISGSHRLTESVRSGLRGLQPNAPPAEWREWNETHSPRGPAQVESMLTLLRGLAHNHDDFSVPLEQLKTVNVPTLLATGDSDQGPALETTLELYRTLPAAALWVTPQAAHCPFWSDIPGGSRLAESLFTPVIHEFLASAERRP